MPSKKSLHAPSYPFVPLMIFVLILLPPKLTFAEEQIVYSHVTDGYWQIWQMGADGKNPRQLTFSKQDKREPVLTGDGANIMFRNNNGELFSISRDGKDEQELLKDIGTVNNPSVSKAADEVVFVRFYPQAIDVSDIWKSDLKGSRRVLLTHDKILKYQPEFSSDGQWIAFVKAAAVGTHQIWLMDSEGKKARQLTKGPGLHILPSFSPDAQTIAFASNRDGNFEIYTLGIETLRLERITHDDGLDTHPCFSTDGQWIYFVSNRSGNEQIWSMNLDGSNPIQLTRGEDESIDPSIIDISSLLR